MERRESKRLSVSLDAELIVNGYTYSVFIGNLSETGLHVFISIPPGSVTDFEKYASYVLRITVESIGRLTLSCKKLWSNELPGSPLVRKIGLLIVNPPAEYKKIYKNLFYKERTEITKRPIAVVGMACHYPGAPCTKHLWENILSRRQEFRRIPDVRLPLDQYFDPDPAAIDKTYGTRAAVIDGFEFDWIKRGIPKTVVESSDISHWLALETALKALEDAGYGLHRVPPDRSGVILGNTLTGEHHRSENLRLRWPFVKKTLLAAADDTGLLPDVQAALAATMESYYKSVFAPVTEDTLAGNLSNTIAGRICNFLNLNGGGYTVDGACSSSLIAVSTAATALSHGNLDLAVVGGVDISLDTFELIGFAKTKALTQDDMRVYDRRASGFIPGEGAGFVVLKRLEDARADGDHVYAVIRGWAISSDGKGGLTAPKAQNQALAIQRAYTGSGYAVTDIDFIEGHGTGTAVGDVAELKGIAQAMGDRAETAVRPCGITSLKSIIGHTKAASGIGGFIKAVMAVNRRVLPPTANCSEPNHTFEKEAHSIYPILQGEIRPNNENLKAGISGMGFGGINCHVTIESGDAPFPKLAPILSERQLLVSGQETELFVISASSKVKLLDRIQTLHKQAEGMSIGELVDFSKQCAHEIGKASPWRAAVLAETPEALLDNLRQLSTRIRENPPAKGEKFIGARKDIFLSHKVKHCKVGFLFPGQGSQQLNMAKTLIDRHEWARTFIANVSQWLKDVESKDVIQVIYKPLDKALGQTQIDEWAATLQETEIAQPAICIASLLWHKKLQRLGINPVAVGGHSLGELIAFHAAGAFNEEALVKLTSLRGRAMAAPGEKRGLMASLGCSYEKAAEILREVEGYVIAANINGPRQIVISGEQKAVENAAAIARRQQIDSRILRVSNAFHSKFVVRAAKEIRQKAQTPEVLGIPKVKLFSGIDGNEVMQGINLRHHFSRQIMSRVDFLSLAKNMAAECDLLLGVGPGNVISSMAQAVIGESGPPCLPVESKPGKDRDLNTFLAYYFVQGGNVLWQSLYEDRLVRPFVSAQDRTFIVNPCERPIKKTKVNIEYPQFSQSNFFFETLTENSEIDSQVLLEYVKQRSSFLESVIKADINNTPLNIKPKKEKTTLEVNKLKEPRPEDVAASNEETVIFDRKSIIDTIFLLLEKQTGFPKEHLNVDMRLLDDLNLDSIKAGDFLTNVVNKLNINDKFNIFLYLNSTISDIAKELDSTIAGNREKTSLSLFPDTPRIGTTWARNMIIKNVRKRINKNSLHSHNWEAENFVICCDSPEYPYAQYFEKYLSNHGVDVEIINYDNCDFAKQSSDNSFKNFIAILPQTPCTAEFSDDVLLMMINRLRSVANSPSSKSGGNSSISFIQFGGGYFGLKPTVAGVNQCTTVAFAASLYYDRPELKIRVIDFDSRVEPKMLVEKTLLEITTSANYEAVGYDRKLIRRVPTPKIHEPADYRPRKISWSSRDVVLVTGGAKGITAECALAVSLATGARMALVGSSALPKGTTSTKEDDEISNTLSRYQKEGLSAQYYQCDIVNSTAVLELVEKIRAEMGTITGVIHGAAVNNPRALESVSSSEAFREIAPKVMGVINICKALKDSPPKLFVGLSSIIGVSGMIRNAWYAYSNEALNLILCRFEKENPQSSVISIAFSLWDEVGMGVRLGTKAFLTKLGIDAISPEQGIQRFLKLFFSDPREKQIVVAARFKSLETFKPEPYPLPPARRFLDKITYYFPDIEVVSRAKLTLETDSYLKDHDWRGVYLFPTVMGLEAMAQAVAYVTGEFNFDKVRIEKIQLQRPIAVDQDDGTEIEIHAIVLEQSEKQKGRRIQVGIATQQTNFSIEHFSATFVLNDKKHTPSEKFDIPSEPLDIQPTKDLYNGKLLFQGPHFQRIRNLYVLNSKKCIFDSEYNSTSFESDREKWLLGDPFFRDSLLQSGQLLVPKYICLPKSIEYIDRNLANTSKSCLMHGISIAENIADEEVKETLVAVDINGNVVEIINGCVFKVMEHHDDFPAAEEIVAPGERDESIIRTKIKRSSSLLGINAPCISTGFVPGLNKLEKEERRKKELPIIERTVRQFWEKNGKHQQTIGIGWLDTGKPVLKNQGTTQLHVSLSHDQGTILCLTGQCQQGCDLESISCRSREEWLALLGKESEKLLDKISCDTESIDQTCTRIWTAKEVSFKATNSKEVDLQIAQQDGENVCFRVKTAAGDELLILTFPVDLTRTPKRIMAVTIEDFSKRSGKR